jgi:uncharacterized protein YndB with AHSA1/START domain
MTTPPRLSLERRFAGPPAIVYYAWTHPETMRTWIGPAGIDCVHCEADVRVGGRWTFTLREPSGELWTASGVYRELVPDRRLTYTHRWDGPQAVDTLCTVELRDDDGETVMTFTQEAFDTVASRDAHIDGWSQALDKLQAMLEAEMV